MRCVICSIHACGAQNNREDAFGKGVRGVTDDEGTLPRCCVVPHNHDVSRGPDTQGGSRVCPFPDPPLPSCRSPAGPGDDSAGAGDEDGARTPEATRFYSRRDPGTSSAAKRSTASSARPSSGRIEGGRGRTGSRHPDPAHRHPGPPHPAFDRSSGHRDQMKGLAVEMSYRVSGGLLFLFLLAACASPRVEMVPYPAAHLIRDVPFFPQETDQCGPAALAGVLQYWGLQISPQEIASAIYSPSARGTLTLDMALYARRQGLQVRQYQGSLSDLTRRIDQGYPLIVLVDNGFWLYPRYHFLVVVGYTKDGFIVNSGQERLRWLSRERFYRSWKRADLWTLLITPKQNDV
ncbi:MAG: hypothetical protein D6736_14605 [Nitrospinota bacterium]|nr:MAG: hypothetical protein D6736_14605 [Nitrospinota bacterium]